jgi:hypothetical protein
MPPAPEAQRLDDAIGFLRDHAEVNGTRMEERLDDAINVLRNHAEPQITLGQLPPNLTQHQMTSLGYSAATSEPHIPDTVKVERATYNTKKRKEPPDSDTKPSSSVESSIIPNSTSGPPPKSKRSRRYSCSSNADEDEIDDPSNKAVREKERRQANNVRERYVKTGTRYLFLFFLNIDPSYIPSSQRLTYDWNKNDFSIVELLREQCLNREQQDREKTLSFRVLDIRLCTRTTLS